MVAVVAISHVIALKPAVSQNHRPPTPVEPSGGYPGFAVLGLALGSHGTDSGGSTHGSHQNYL